MFNNLLNTQTGTVFLGHTSSAVIFYYRAVHGTSQGSFQTEALTVAITALTSTIYAILVKTVVLMFRRMFYEYHLQSELVCLSVLQQLVIYHPNVIFSIFSTSAVNYNSSLQHCGYRCSSWIMRYSWFNFIQITLPVVNYPWRQSIGVGRMFSPFVCLSGVSHKSKMKDPKVFKLGIGNDLWISYK